MKKITQNRRWTVEQEDRMLRLEAQGLKHEEIAEVLGRTKLAISGRLHIIRKREQTPAQTPNMLGTKEQPSSTPLVTTLVSIIATLLFALVVTAMYVIGE